MELDMYAVGVKQKDIYQYCGMPKSKVLNIVARGQKNTKESNNENHGRNPKLIKRSIQS